MNFDSLRFDMMHRAAHDWKRLRSESKLRTNSAGREKKVKGADPLFDQNSLSLMSFSQRLSTSAWHCSATGAHFSVRRCLNLP